VTGLQTRVSDGYIQVLELQDVVREQMGRFNGRNHQAELPPLWYPSRIRSDAQTSALVRQSYAAQRSLTGYYFAENWDYWVWMALLALAFFAWVFQNFRALRLAAAATPATGATAVALPELPEHHQ
jgi:potassium efflux system protein